MGDGQSLVLYGGDDQTTNEIGALGDLWMYSPRTKNDDHDHDHASDQLAEDEWQVDPSPPLSSSP